MAKHTKSAFDDGELDEVPVAEETGHAKAENQKVIELFAGPKTQETGGDGTGGRPWVYSGDTLRQVHQGDQIRPQCPRCSNDQVAVLCTASSSTTIVTHYKCPRCNFTAQKLRTGVAQQLQSERNLKRAVPFVERP